MAGDSKARWQAAIENQGLAILRDLLSQVEGLEWTVVDAGGCLIALVALPEDGGSIGITRGTASQDYQSPDGWLACYYSTPDAMFSGDEEELMDNATFTDLLRLFVQFAPDPSDRRRRPPPPGDDFDE